MMADDTVAIVIASGGRSSRMGVDKSQLRLDGVSLRSRLIATALAFTDDVAIVGGGRRDSDDDAVRYIEDEFADGGPLVALHTALGETGKPTVYLACDLPHMNADYIRWLVSCWDQRDCEPGLVARYDGRMHPLASMYSPTARRCIDETVAGGQRSFRAFYEQHPCAVVDVPEALSRALTNVNTPEEFRAATGCEP